MKYSIYIAMIEGVSSLKDNRLTVRVLPDMEDISGDNLPKWPCFIRNELITGKQGQLVWVIANEEFTTGYVLGYANFTTWKDDYEIASVPVDLYNALDDASINLGGKMLSYSDLQISFWNENTIHFVERNSGACIVAFRNGTIHRIKPEGVDIQVGSSIFQIKENEIIISAETLKLEGEKVLLGKNPQGKVFVSPGASGGNSVPSKGVWG